MVRFAHGRRGNDHNCTERNWKRWESERRGKINARFAREEDEKNDGGEFTKSTRNSREKSKSGGICFEYQCNCERGEEKKSEETTGVLAITEDINSDDDSDNEEHNSHYWGQSLQYLERAVQIKGGKKIAVLAKREADIVRFSLKEGVGSWVGKPPWKIEWGGGASGGIAALSKSALLSTPCERLF